MGRGRSLHAELDRAYLRLQMLQQRQRIKDEGFDEQQFSQVAHALRSHLRGRATSQTDKACGIPALASRWRLFPTYAHLPLPIRRCLGDDSARKFGKRKTNASA
ncbi:hypothetical protein X743_00720 [Mesorhizobium sp. LNHC252B00]|nr:hypothetical protein X743_00720 [Mesorhizobium sp. LNHC252B00]